MVSVDEYRKALRDVEKNLFGKKFDYFERNVPFTQY